MIAIYVLSIHLLIVVIRLSITSCVLTSDDGEPIDLNIPIMDEDENTDYGFTSTSGDQNKIAGSKKKKPKAPNKYRTGAPQYIDIRSSCIKKDLLHQKELEMNGIGGSFHKEEWNWSELNRVQADSLCVTLWMRINIADIEGFEEMELIRNPHPSCKAILRATSRQDRRYNIQYANLNNVITNSYYGNALRCHCHYKRTSLSAYTVARSYRCFFVHKFSEKEYFILTPVKKLHAMLMKMVDVIEIDPLL